MFLAACVTWALAAGSVPETPRAPPCAACLAWEVTPAEALAFLAGPVSMAGLDVVLRAPTGSAVVGEAARTLSQRGAAVTLAVPADTVPDGPLATSARGVILEATSLSGAPAERLFAIKEQAVRWRAAAPGSFQIGVEAAASDLTAFLEGGLASYVDVLLPTDAVALEAPPGLAVWGRARPAEPSLSALLEATRGREPGRVVVSLDSVPPGVAQSLDALRDWLPAGLTPLPEVAISCGGTGRCEAEVFLHPATLDAVAWLHPADADPGRIAETALVRPPARVTSARDLGPSGALLRIASWAGTGDGFAASVDVRDRVMPTVEEILARHQAWAARQARRVVRLVSHGSTLLTFRVPGLAAPMTVTAETTLFTGGGVVEMMQKDVRLNGTPVAMGRDGVPHLPLVEPERAAAAPLALSLDERYRYRLLGLARVAGHDAYRVSFTPRPDAASLFHGQAWITADDFALARIEATQTRLAGAIVASRQDDESAPQAVAGGIVWLPRRTEVHQIYEGPGHRTPVERAMLFTRHEVNPADFDHRRLAAHASADVMLRETPEGWRYLRRAVRPPAFVPAGGAAPPNLAFREVAGRATRVFSLALGALFDPNIENPLPFVGFSYVDLDFLGTGAQVNALVAGPFLQAAWSVPSLRGTAWQVQGSAFASLVAYNDRAFEAGIEQYEQNVRQRPARVSIGLLRPGRLRLRGAYELGLTRYSRGDSTAPGFRVPASPLVHALRVAVEADRGPWTGALWGVAAVRQHWHPWGVDSGTDTPRTFQRFGAEASRTVVLSAQGVLRVEGAWVDGRRLDRFSRFNFDAVDNRLRGYPSAALRYDRGGALRTVATWRLAPQVRASAFIDVARVRDPGYGRASRTYPGTGAALDLPLPFRSVAALDWGYGFEAPNRDGGKGAHVFRITAYKLF